jgi:hypothetical protein
MTRCECKRPKPVEVRVATIEGGRIIARERYRYCDRCCLELQTGRRL